MTSSVKYIMCIVLSLLSTIDKCVGTTNVFNEHSPIPRNSPQSEETCPGCRLFLRGKKSSETSQGSSSDSTKSGLHKSPTLPVPNNTPISNSHQISFPHPNTDAFLASLTHALHFGATFHRPITPKSGFVQTVGVNNTRSPGSPLEEILLSCPYKTPAWLKNMTDAEIDEHFREFQLEDAFWISLFCRRNDLIVDIMKMMNNRTRYGNNFRPAIELQLQLDNSIISLIRNHAKSPRLRESLHATLHFFDRQNMALTQPLSALDIAIITDKQSVIPNLAANYYSIAQSM